MIRSRCGCDDSPCFSISLRLWARFVMDKESPSCCSSSFFCCCCCLCCRCSCIKADNRLLKVGLVSGIGPLSGAAIGDLCPKGDDPSLCRFLLLLRRSGEESLAWKGVAEGDCKGSVGAS